MTLFGISLRKPGFGEVTAAAVMAVGIWLTLCGIARVLGAGLGRGEAGALLLVVCWACLAARLGLSIDASRRHAALNLGVAALLLGGYEAALAFG